MSCETDAMNSLRNAIRDELPSLKNEIRNMNTKNEDLIEALNRNTRAHNISAIITLCEISVKRPYYNIFSTEEVMNIYINLRDEFREMGNARSNGEKQKTKKIGLK